MSRGPVPENPESDALAAKLAARIGRRLRSARLKAKLSLRALDAISGVSYDSIRRIENGDDRASLRVYVRLCRALGLDARSVLGG